MQQGRGNFCLSRKGETAFLLRKFVTINVCG
nr:MAG TPA: hypothetical protein [Bacteriophage sp.]DAR43905.1 MAG TPA: hypothetical protein [Caudoviricetes sp.]DAU18650.1 MAG TPA: hypothetical protein [Caudoviricetes sp.]DAU45393.1 MAG TPA: hypothetical protein [Caudoviricetes sp.]